jgi:hypothetical protein
MQVEIFPSSVLLEREGLAARAQEVLGQNDMGGWTRAASDLYPHQWSWDSGFIAMGLAHLDTGRAARELLTLFQHQWKPGKVPHIVFDPQAPPDSYFPGAEHWACAAASPEAPPALHKLLVPAANPRNRCSEDLGSRRQWESSSGSYCLPARHLPRAPLLAPLSPRVIVKYKNIHASSVSPPLW